MKQAVFNIDRKAMAKATAKHVRAKALKYGNELIYVEDGNIIAEDPKTGKKKILNKSTRKLVR